ncbi:MAG: sporulation integral membrane protein YtvI [Clostridia bacterium]|nr:sporulation integral membrane protein YtvI [Clostridia bacterium]
MIKKKTVKGIIFGLILIALIVVIVIFFPTIMQFLWSLFLVFIPFILAYIVSLVANGLADALQKRFRLPRSLAAILVIFLTVVVLGGILGGIVWKIIDEIKQIYENFPSIYQGIQGSWDRLSRNLSDIVEQLPDNIQLSIESLYEQFMNGLANLFKDVKIFRTAGNIAKRLPSILISVITFVLSLYFMISDSEEVAEFLRKYTPKPLQIRVSQLKKEVKRYLGGYLKAQLIMMSISFVIILIGLLILRIDYALIIAIAIAIFDALPFFGSGAILIPWSIIAFLSGNASNGVGLLIIYLSVFLMRQLIEPKIVGKSIGMHPLLTLMSMYAGYHIFSIGGLILGPLALTLIISFYKVGLFNDIIKFCKTIYGRCSKEVKQIVSSFNNEGE